MSSRVTLISSAGLYLEGQPPFRRDGDDGTFRRIRAEDDLARLRIDWDAPARQDINCAFPLALLREMATLAPVHYSFNSVISEAGARQLASELDADAVILVPS